MDNEDSTGGREDSDLTSTLSLFLDVTWLRDANRTLCDVTALSHERE